MARCLSASHRLWPFSLVKNLHLVLVTDQPRSGPLFDVRRRSKISRARRQIERDLTGSSLSYRQCRSTSPARFPSLAVPNIRPDAWGIASGDSATGVPLLVCGGMKHESKVPIALNRVKDADFTPTYRRAVEAARDIPLPRTSLLLPSSYSLCCASWSSDSKTILLYVHRLSSDCRRKMAPQRNQQPRY